MSIVNLYHIKEFLIAACDNGSLVAWQLSGTVGKAVSQERKLAPQLAHSKLIIKVAPKLIGLEEAVQNLIGFDSASFFIISKEGLCNDIAKGQFTSSIGKLDFCLSQQNMTCLVSPNENVVLFGTSKTSLVKYSLSSSSILQKMSLEEEEQNIPTQILFPQCIFQRNGVVEISMKKNKRQVFVGTANGNIFSIEIENMTILKKFKLDCIDTLNCMTLADNENLLLSAHQNIVLGWNSRTGSCTFTIEMKNSTAVNIFSNGLFVIAGDNSTIQWVNNCSVQSIPLSMRIATCLKKIILSDNQCLLAGGADALVDIFFGRELILTLFPL